MEINSGGPVVVYGVYSILSSFLLSALPRYGSFSPLTSTV